MLLYYILFLIIIYLFIVGYIKIKYGAWTYQPVFQYFNLFYWIKDDFIIRPQKPPLHKYCNLIDIKTKDINELSREKLDTFIGFIQGNYLKNTLAEYKPTLLTVLSSLEGCNNVLLSLYEKPKMLLDVKSGQAIYTDEIVGSIISKPCLIHFEKRKFTAFYADLLCINPAYRKKGAAAELIQTHEYERSHNTNNYTFFLVKRESKLSYIVPLVLFDVHQYRIKDIIYNRATGEKYKYMSLLFAKYSLIKINKSNVQLVIEYIEEIRSKIPCVIIPEIANLYSMISNNIFIIYALVRDHKLYALYVYKKSDMILYFNNKKEYQIDLISSVFTCEKNVFLAGFRHSLTKILNNKNSPHYLLIENISTNNIILDELKKEYIKYIFKSVCAYYLYNYAKRPYFHYDTFIVI